MINNDKNIGYDYIISLCEAIDTLTKKEESDNPSAYIYRGSNLRFAHERALYFNYANNKYFFDIFATCHISKKPKKIVVNNVTERKLISLLCAIEETSVSIRETKWFEKLKNGARYIVRYSIIFLGMDMVANYIRKNINKWKQRNIHLEILFCVQSARIVKYLVPISSKMIGEYAYITHDKQTADFLRSENLPFICVSRFGYSVERWAKKKDVLYKSVITDKYDLLFDSIKEIKPKTVVVAEGNTPYDEITNRICKQCGIRSVCVQQGWAFFVGHTGFRNMTYSKMLVWGNSIVHNLSLYNPNQKFIVTGSHIVSTRDFKTEKISTVSLFSQGETFIINKMAAREFILLAKQIIIECSGTKVIIREHPLYPLASVEKERLEKIGIIFMSPTKYSLDEVFEKSDLIISIFSSVILESMASGIIPMVFNPNLFPDYFANIEIKGVGIEAKSVKEAVSTIKRLVENPNEMKKYKEPIDRFRKEYFAFDKKTALENIIREITS